LVTQLPVKKGIDGIPTALIPTEPGAFVSWFTNSFLPRWAANGDTRNAVSGPGISITGNISSPATVSVSTELQALFEQPYVLVGTPAAGAPLTDYRSIAAQVGVVSLTDAGAESSLTVGIANNGIGNLQIRQGVGTSIIGNASGSTANVADIAAGADNTTLVRAGGVLSFSALPLAAIAAIANDTVVGNSSGGSAAPIALNQTQLTALINVATASLPGALPVLSGNTAQFLNGAGAWATPAYPTGANPSDSIGLAAVNGSAATFMRSDGSPALSQAIAPTWTGSHAFTGAPSYSSTITGASIGANGTSASHTWNCGGAGLNNKLWEIYADTSGTLYHRLLNDAVSGALTYMTVARTGITGANISFAGGTVQMSGAVGWNGATPPAQVTGFGTPVGGLVVASYNITDAGGANSNTNKCVAEILSIMKAHGMIGA
jgi:hypothetical protein